MDFFQQYKEKVFLQDTNIQTRISDFLMHKAFRVTCLVVGIGLLLSGFILLMVAFLI